MQDLINDIHDLFYNSKFDELIAYVRECDDVNSYEVSYFMISSFLAINDIYGAKSYIFTNKFLNSNEVKSHFNEDISVYSLMKEESDLNIASCLILMNFVNEYDVKDLDKNHLYFEYYEMIDTIYSLSYDNNIIEYLINNGKIIFQGIDLKF